MTIKFLPQLLLIVAVLALVVRTAHAADEIHEGKVLVVTSDSITVHDDRDGDDDKFSVTAETKITYNGKPAKLTEISAGDRAKVIATQKGDKLIAKEISARSAE